LGIKKFLVSKMLTKWEERDKSILAKQQLPDGIEAIVDVPYAEDGQRGHLLDVYYPKGAKEKLPVIMDIHGGGFLYGDKDINKLYGHHLAKRGFVVFNLNYRLAFNDAKVPGQIQDIVSAINWIGNNLDTARKINCVI
jgi:acetyl esterase